MSDRLCLVTGVSGYVGGRLVRELEAQGEPVRCLARRPEFVRPRVGDETEVVRGDALDPQSLRAAMLDVNVAYYLIHSMASAGDFESEDRRAAGNFAAAAREAGVRRIVYLGGLGREPGLSRHLRSRQEVASGGSRLSNRTPAAPGCRDEASGEGLVFEGDSRGHGRQCGSLGRWQMSAAPRPGEGS